MVRKRLARRATLSFLSVGLLVASCSAAGGVPTTQGGNGSAQTTQADTTIGSLPPTSGSVPGSSGIPQLDPIEGYGDFSGLTWWEIDPFQISELVVRCLRDNGFPVTYSLPGDGISFRDIPPEQSPMVQAYLQACYEGLNVPSEHEPPDRAVAEKAYHYNLALAECLVDRGYNPPAAPSMETYVEDFINRSQTIWGPYIAVPFPPDDLLFECPQTPSGGFAAWEIGDGIERLPPMQELPPIGGPPN